MILYILIFICGFCIGNTIKPIYFLITGKDISLLKKEPSIDIFAPHTEPAKTIYNVLTEEMKNRDGYIMEEWILNERITVWKTAIRYCFKNGLYIPTIQDVEKAEKEAYGSADYDSKWAIKLSNLILENSK